MSCLDWVRANCCCCCGPRSAPVTDAGDDCAPEAVVTQPVQVHVRIPPGLDMITATPRGVSPRISPNATTVSGGSAGTTRIGRSTGSPSQRPTPDRGSVSAVHLGRTFSFEGAKSISEVPRILSIIAECAPNDIWTDILIREKNIDAADFDPFLRKFALLCGPKIVQCNLGFDLKGWQFKQIACFFVGLKNREPAVASSPVVSSKAAMQRDTSPHALSVLDAVRYAARKSASPLAATPQEVDYDALGSNERVARIRSGAVEIESALIRLQVRGTGLQDSDFADLPFLKTLEEVHITEAATITPAIIDAVAQLPKLKKLFLFKAVHFTEMFMTRWRNAVEARFPKLNALANFQEMRCDILSWPPRSTANSLAADRPALPAASYEPERSNVGGVMSREPSQASEVHIAIPGVVRLPKIPGVLGDSAHPSQSSSKRSQHSSVQSVLS